MAIKREQNNSKDVIYSRQIDRQNMRLFSTNEHYTSVANYAKFSQATANTNEGKKLNVRADCEQEQQSVKPTQNVT